MESQSVRGLLRAVAAAGSLAFFVLGSAAYFVRLSSVLFFENRPVIDVLAGSLHNFMDLM